MKTSIIIPWPADDKAMADAAVRAAASGFDGLEIMTPRPTAEATALSEEWCRRLRDIIDGAKLGISAISIEHHAAEDFAITGAGRDRPWWTKMLDVIDAARWLGTEGVILRTDMLGAIGGEEKSRKLETIHPRTMSALWGLRGRAELRAIRIACLSGEGGLSHSPTETRRLLDEINSPWVGLCLDLAGMTPTEAAEWIDLLGHRIARVRLDDAALEGDTSLEQVAAALQRIHYDGWVTYQGNRDWSDADGRLRRGLPAANGR